jgi:transposase
MAFDLSEVMIGMLVVETIAKIRRAYFQQKKAIKAICREFGVSRKVVRKVIRTNATEFIYERERQPLPKIGPWKDQLDQLLLCNAGKSSRERLTLIRVYEELSGLGYTGSYDAVRRYAKDWSKEQGAVTAEAFVPLTFAPGEAYQFDWSHEIVLIGGVTSTVKVAHVRLCHSRMFFVRAYPRETQEMVFDGRCHRNFQMASRSPDTNDSLHAAVAARHVSNALPRRARNVRREVKCRWVLKVLCTAA